MSLEEWKSTWCVCGHAKYEHADEHDEIPTGTGKCEDPKGCKCESFRPARPSAVTEQPDTRPESTEKV
jgi:hypothetical protein